jgi:hypothetical protein
VGLLGGRYGQYKEDGIEWGIEDYAVSVVPPELMALYTGCPGSLDAHHCLRAEALKGASEYGRSFYRS